MLFSERPCLLIELYERYRREVCAQLYRRSQSGSSSLRCRKLRWAFAQASDLDEVFGLVIGLRLIGLGRDVPNAELVAGAGAQAVAAAIVS